MNTEQNHYRIVLSTLFCFAFHVFLYFAVAATVAILLINQIRIEIIFRIHMPGRINQKRERKKNYTTITVVMNIEQQQQDRRKKMKQQQKHKTKIAGLVIHRVENYA